MTRSLFGRALRRYRKPRTIAVESLSERELRDLGLLPRAPRVDYWQLIQRERRF